MKKIATWVFTLFAFGFGAVHAATVTESQVRLAAKGWAVRGGTLGSRIGVSVEKVSAHSTTNGALFYAVKMSGGGTLFMSSDTDFSPVVAFTSSGEDFSSIDRKSPLWSLLNRDLSMLKSASESIARASAANNTATARKMAALADVGSKLWGELIADGEKANLSYGDPITDGDPGDLRVGPLVKSKWSQSLSNGKACWNYYTPNGSNPSKFVEGDAGNVVCGCVATAMAQIMRYHSYPTASLSPLTRGCFWGSTAMSLTTQGGVYDWEKMELVPDGKDGLADENYQAIGKLASDAGISVYMQYNSDGEGLSGAFAFDISGAMKNYWQYGSAVYFGPSSIGEQELAGVCRSALYSNFDAGLPVFMGIPGHQIVADGYGWNNELEYVHLNMGWAGQNDFWYNLPDMTVAGPAYNAVEDLVYNVIPDGNVSSAVISGRTLDDDGNPLAGCIVELYQSGALVTQAVSSAQGVWGVVVAAGTYQISACSADGLLLGEIENALVAKPYPVDVTWNNLRKVPTVRTVGGIGNSWGNDITLSNPSVRVGGVLYSSLEKGLAAAKGFSIPAVEILAATELRKSVSIDFDCAIFSVEADPADTMVLRRGDAQLVVAAGGNLTLSNVVFSASQSTPVDVAAGGKLTVAGTLDFGVDYDVADIAVAAADALVVAGALEFGFALDCAAAPEIGQTFGVLTGLSAEDAAQTAAKIVNFNDDTGEIRGSVEGANSPFVLKWDEVPVPFDECMCYYVDDEQVTNTSARIDRLLVKFENDFIDGKVSAGAEIVVKKSGSLSKSLTIGADVSVRGENGAVLDASDPASFVVTNGTLTVRGLGFVGFKGNAIFLVDGGELAIGDGVSITGMTGTNYHSGAVAVLKGTATLGPGVTIADCGFAYAGGGNGAGVYVNSGATLNFFGGTITGCEATGNGGGIYVHRKANLNLKGEISISDNRKYSQDRPNNIYAYGSSSTVSVVGPISGDIGIAYGSTAGTYNKEGGAFAKIASGLSVKDMAGIGRGMEAFINDTDSKLSATFSGDQNSLVWTGDSVAAGTVPDNLVAYAFARVVEPGGEIAYYWSVADAFNAVDADGSSVEMLQSDNFDGELAVDNSEVRLVSALEDGVASLTGGTFKVTGSLVLTNVVAAGENLFNVAGGQLLLDAALLSEVGCVGGTALDPMLFARVRCDLAYDSLTNSAANFRNREIDAYGVAVTNAAADTAVVWSRAIGRDGTFTDASGTVWNCVGDVPVYEIEVVPVPIAFSSIVRDADTGVWSLTLTNLVSGCWYSLYATNSLVGGFAVGEGIAAPVTNFQAEADGEFIFKVESDGGTMFWKAIAAPGVIAE